MQQGLTTVTATVFGPREPKAQTRPVHDRAVVNVEVGEAGWASQGGKRTRGDKCVSLLGDVCGGEALMGR